MYFDLNFPIQKPLSMSNISKKGKAPQYDGSISFSAAEISSIEARIDLMTHLGYSVLAFSQTVNKRVDPKTHVNILNPLLSRLRPRQGFVYLKRLNIILDQDSEKGFGMINANLSIFNSYDLLALIPTTHATFSLATLTHSLPSNLTAHIIALPLTLPRLPYHLKHTLVRTAIKNGAVFEINYVGSLGGESDSVLLEANAAESGASARRNWWASTRELVRVTKGKGLLISGGVVTEVDLRGPRDVANLIAIVGLPQDAAHEASSKIPKSLIVRSQTRKTYRAVLSEPSIVLLPQSSAASPQAEPSTRGLSMKDEPTVPHDSGSIAQQATVSNKRPRTEAESEVTTTSNLRRGGSKLKSKKRKQTNGSA